MREQESHSQAEEIPYGKTDEEIFWEETDDMLETPLFAACILEQAARCVAGAACYTFYLSLPGFSLPVPGSCSFLFP